MSWTNLRHTIINPIYTLVETHPCFGIRSDNSGDRPHAVRLGDEAQARDDRALWE